MCSTCLHSIDSVVELLWGRLLDDVDSVVGEVIGSVDNVVNDWKADPIGGRDEEEQGQQPDLHSVRR